MRYALAVRRRRRRAEIRQLVAALRRRLARAVRKVAHLSTREIVAAINGVTQSSRASIAVDADLGPDGRMSFRFRVRLIGAVRR